MPIQRANSFWWLTVPLTCVLIAAAQPAAGGSADAPNFVATRTLPDGELDRRVHFGRVTAKETTALISKTKKQAAANAKLPERGIRFVQVTDGRHFVQAIYDAGYGLKDCEYVRDAGAVSDFLHGLRDDFALARKALGKEAAAGTVLNGTAIAPLDSARVKGDVGRLLDYEFIRNECKVLHQKMKDMAKRAKKADGDGRKKRELFIYPGTNWCGMGSNSEGFNDLGLNAAADRCCRQHDHCPYTIEGFVTKFNLFNYRFHTLSHCECDERFRTCLKMVDNGPSNLVGKLFFNVVQMKCFQLKAEKTCTKRSWWGRCLKHEKQLTAHIKDVLTY